MNHSAGGFLDRITYDLRHALRALIRRPGFALAAIITLGVGIGANTTVFSVVDGVLLRPLPYDNPEQLVGVFRYDSTYMGSDPSDASISGWYSVPIRLFRDWEDLQHTYSDLGAYRTPSVTLTDRGRPERVAAAIVTSGVFTTLNVQPFLGRTFVPDDDRVGQPALAVLSHGLWQRRLGSDSTVVGQQLGVNGTPHTIVGIMPAGFGFPDGGEQLWTTFEEGYKTSTNRRGGNVQVIARMLPGVSFDAAARDMDAMARQIHEVHPADPDQGIRLVPRKEMEVARSRSGLLLMLGAVVLVLLIACSNIAGLLLVRATERHHELCLRRALGAGRRRLLGQLLTESMVLSVMGGALGCAMALVSIRPFAAMLPGRLPRIEQVGMDYRMLGFTLGLAILTGVLMGVLPAVRAATSPLAGALQQAGRGMAGGRRRNRAQSVLVVSEIAMAFMLLVGAGLFVKSFVRLTNVDRGFVSQNILRMRLVLPDPYRASDRKARGFFEDLTERLASLPGVEAAAGASQIPFVDGMSLPPTLVETASGIVETAVHSVVITPTYLQTLEVPLVAGRMITSQDRPGGMPVAVVNRAMAERYWPDEDPLGRRIKSPNDSLWITVVGVVGDVRQQLRQRPLPTIYASAGQFPSWYQTIVLKTAIDPASVAAMAREAVWALDPTLPATVEVLDELIDRSRAVAQPRFASLALTVLAGAAALLAVLGIYSVLAYTVTQRTHEIGIRVALGAGTGNVVRGILRRGAVLAATGLGIGFLGAILAMRLLGALLFGVSPTDPVTLASVTILVGGAALAASYLPARRATRIDPLTALRSE